MSEKEDDIFKELFQKEFQNRREAVEEETWDFIAARLEKKRFYKFSFSRFNIVYSLLTIALFSISGISLFVWLGSQGYLDTNSFFNTMPDHKTLDSSVIITDTLSPVEANEKNNKTKSIIKDVTSNRISSPVKTEVSKNDTLIPGTDTNAVSRETPSFEKADSVSPVPPKENKKKVVKKTIYVIKQDTLIKMDTIRPNKRKNKK